MTTRTHGWETDKQTQKKKNCNYHAIVTEKEIIFIPQLPCYSNQKGNHIFRILGYTIFSMLHVRGTNEQHIQRTCLY